jgi:hypothetical protein
MVVNVILLIVGCFLDPTSAIIVLTPLFIPIVKSLGIDPIHFGIVMTVNIAIGMFTPPFGLNLSSHRPCSASRSTRSIGVLPFAVVQIAALLDHYLLAGADAGRALERFEETTMPVTACCDRVRGLASACATRAGPNRDEARQRHHQRRAARVAEGVRRRPAETHRRQG